MSIQTLQNSISTFDLSLSPQHNLEAPIKPIRCLQINLRHCRAAALSLSQLIIDLDVDLALIQEPYAISDPLPRLKYVPPDYVDLHNLSDDHAYGAAIIARKSLKALLVPLIGCNSAVGVKIVSSQSEHYFFSIYCRPSISNLEASLANFFSHLTPKIIEKAVFCFDSNAKNPLWNSKVLDQKGRLLEDLLVSHNISVENASLLSLPHIPLNTSFLDITGAGATINISNWHFPDYPSLSDHPYISFSVNLPATCSRLSHQDKPQHKFPRLDTCVSETYLNLLYDSLADFPLIEPSPDLIPPQIDIYLSELMALLRACATGSKSHPHPSHAPSKMPWWNKTLWDARALLRDAYNVKRQNPTNLNVLRYTELKSKYQRLLRRSKDESWKEFCSSDLNDDLFGALKKLAIPSNIQIPSALKVDNVILQDPKSILAEFGKSFFPANPAPTAAQAALERSVEATVSTTVGPTLSNFVTLMELRSAFDGLKVTNSPGIDGFSAAWLNLSFDLLSGHLISLFNCCITTSYFPSNWRIANVVILPKQNKPSYDATSSFRPISILCSMSKLFERVIHSRLKVEEAKSGWFSAGQHGFRAGRSTESAASDLVGLIENNMKKRLFTSCAFLDIKSAFDSAWQPAILNRLLRKGCPLYLVKLLRSYLNDRKANLSGLGSEISVKTEIGCPQGSVLSPFLWNVLVDEVLEIAYPFPHKIIAYADDLVLCAYDRDPSVATKNLQTMCDTTILWGSSVKLGFNASKTVFIIFTRCKQVLPDLYLCINQSPIPRTNKCTYLGLIIDERLSWKEHVTNKVYSSKRLMFTVRKCCRLTWGLTRKSLTTMYKVIFLPKILYGCSIWGGATRFKWCIKLLHSAQRPLVLAICRTFRTTSTIAATLLADVLPLELEVKKLVARRALSVRANFLAPSAAHLVQKLVCNVQSTIISNNNPGQQQRKIISNSIWEEWNGKWQLASAGEQTRQFFPSVPECGQLSKLKPSSIMIQLLTGHCLLNDFLAKIKKIPSPKCICNLDNESVVHFLFNCPLYSTHRTPLIQLVQQKGLPWPPDLHLLLSDEILWSAMNSFVVASKRFIRPKGHQSMLSNSGPRELRL